jgi:hypothetical protein
MIELCLCICNRIERLHTIIEDLKKQNNQKFTVNIWNNTTQPIKFIDFPNERINITNSDKNIGSKARFQLAKKTTGNPVIFIDDDEILSPDFIDYFYSEYQKFGPNCILGCHARNFDHEHYWNSLLIDTRKTFDIEVDYIGTGGMILDRWIIDQEKSLQNIPEPYDKVEDLYLSYIARMKYDMKLIAIESKDQLFKDDSYQLMTQYQNRQNAFKSLRNAGWCLLRDKNMVAVA